MTKKLCWSLVAADLVAFTICRVLIGEHWVTIVLGALLLPFVVVAAAMVMAAGDLLLRLLVGLIVYLLPGDHE